MRRAAYNLGVIAMIMGALWIIGCGSSDVLDEVGQRYTATLTVLELDEATLQVDVVQDVCSDDNGTITVEDFSDALGEIEITAAEDTTGLTLQSYTIEYIPLGSVDQLGTSRMPPDLTDPSDGVATVNIPANSTVTFTITLISVDSKTEYVVKSAGDATLANLLVARYLVRVTMHFEDTAGNDRDIEVERTVFFSDYDHC